jgi:uncharacterized membrane protein
MDQISPFITSITKKASSNPKIMIGIAISVVCIIFVCTSYSYQEESNEQIKKKDCPKIKDCNSYSSSLCFLVIIFIYLVATKKITINSPIMAIVNKGLPPVQSVFPTPKSMIPMN